MPDEYGDKTEQATDHRRQEARRKGMVARSQDLSSAGLTLAAAVVLALLARPLLESLAGVMRSFLRGPAWRGIDERFAAVSLGYVIESAAIAVLPMLLILAAAVVMTNLVQVGFLIAPEALQPKLSRINPIQGAKRLFSMQALMRLVVNLFKLLVVAGLATWFISAVLPQFAGATGAEPAVVYQQIEHSTVSLAFQLALALIALALIDFGFQRWKHERDLRMSKQEIREEMKQMEGDPQIRQRRREAHKKLAQARELQAVESADLVVRNPTHIAVAIKYDPQTMAAPTVVAKGMGAIAERIIAIAKAHNIPTVERKPLAHALYKTVKVGQPVPVEMYEAFVELMAWVYRLTGRALPELDSA